MLETSARLLRLLSLLQRGRSVTGSAIADQLGVSGRTVRADVERLRRLGYPVYAARGSVGGYRLGAGVDGAPLLLDDDEAIAVAVALRVATVRLLPGTEETTLSALAKLDHLLAPGLRRRVAALSSHMVSVPEDSPAAPVDPSLLMALACACRDRVQVRFEYRSHDREVGRRRVEPYHVVNWGRRWYLIAWDIDRADWRMFRVDRIGASAAPERPGAGAVTRTSNYFALRQPPWTDVSTYVAANSSAAAWRYRAQVTVYAPADVVAERINAAVGTVESIDDHTCLLRTGADSIGSLAVHLGLLDLDFTVAGPPELVAQLRRLGRRFARAGRRAGPRAATVS